MGNVTNSFYSFGKIKLEKFPVIGKHINGIFIESITSFDQEISKMLISNLLILETQKKVYANTMEFTPYKARNINIQNSGRPFF